MEGGLSGEDALRRVAPQVQVAEIQIRKEASGVPINAISCISWTSGLGGLTKPIS